MSTIIRISNQELGRCQLLSESVTRNWGRCQLLSESVNRNWEMCQLLSCSWTRNWGGDQLSSWSESGTGGGVSTIIMISNQKPGTGGVVSTIISIGNQELGRIVNYYRALEPGTWGGVSTIIRIQNQCTYRLNRTRRTSWGWWDEWDGTALQTQDSEFEPWQSEGEHATSQSRRLPTTFDLY